MKRMFVVIGLVASFAVAGAQKKSLSKCCELAILNYPKSVNKEIIEANTQMEVDQLVTEWYPKITLNASIAYQNDVPHVDVGALPFSMPQAPKDQYKSYLDVNQILYDGGVISARKESQLLKGKEELMSLAVEQYALRQRVADVFFLVFVLNEQQALLQFKEVDVAAQLKNIQSRVNAGAFPEDERKVLLVEQLKLNQLVIEVEEGLSASLATLSQLIGEHVNTVQELELTAVMSSENDLQRPELDFFMAKEQQLQVASVIAGRLRRPTLMAFGQAGYGNPSYNMLMDKFDTFYMVGLRLQWRITDWKKTQKQKFIFEKNREMVQSQADLFKRNINVAGLKISGEITKLEKLLLKDNEIVLLREDITRMSRSKLQNGAITSSEYLIRLNEETAAKLNYKLHEVQLNKARSDYRLLMGQM